MISPGSVRHSPATPGDAWFWALFVVGAVIAALSAGMVAALAPTIAMIAAVLSGGGMGLWFVLRRMHASVVTGQAAIHFQIAFGLLLVSLVRVAQRDPTASALGFQAIYEFSLQGLAGAFIVLGMVAAKSRINVSPALMAWIVVGTFAVISAFWAPQPPLSVVKGLQLIAVCVMAAFSASQFRDRYQAVRFLAWFTVVMILCAVLFQGVTEGFGNLRTVTNQYDQRLRLDLLMIHPIYLGGFAGTVASLLLIHLRKRIDWLALAFLVAITTLTAARGPMGALFLLLILYAALRSRINIHSYLAWAAGILMTIITLGAGLLTMPSGPATGGGSSTLGNLERDITTLNGRIPLWKSILERTEDGSDLALAPLVGHGYASFRHFGLSQFSYAGDAHNAVIQVFSELGLIGCLFWLLAIGACTRRVWSCERSQRARLISILPIFYILTTQMMDASLADSRSFLLVILLFYAHVGWNQQAIPETSPAPEPRASPNPPHRQQRIGHMTR